MEEAPSILWQSQATEASRINFEAIRARAEDLHGTVRWRNLGEYCAGAVVLLSFGSHLQSAHGMLLRLGDLCTIAAVMFVFWQLHRRGSARNIPPDLDAQAYQQAYRNELRRQRDALQKVPLWYEAPFVPGLVFIMFGTAHRTGRWGPTIAFAAVMAIVFAAVWYMNVLQAGRLQARIDELEKEEALLF